MEKTAEPLVRKIFDAYVRDPAEDLDQDRRAVLVSFFGLLLNRSQVLATFKASHREAISVSETSNAQVATATNRLQLTPIMLASMKDTLERGLGVLQSLEILDDEMDVSRQSLVALGQKATPIFLKELEELLGQQRQKVQNNLVKKFLEKSKLESSTSMFNRNHGAQQAQEAIKGPLPTPANNSISRAKDSVKSEPWDLAALVAADSDEIPKGTSFGASEEEIVANLEEDLLSLVGRMKRYAHTYRDQLQADKAVGSGL